MYQEDKELLKERGRINKESTRIDFWNPTVSEYFDANPNKTMFGLAWGIYWRIFIVAFAIGIIAGILSEI